MLLKKLPAELIVEWKTRGETEHSSVMDLLDFIEKDVKFKELATQLRKDNQPEPKKHSLLRTQATLSQFVATTGQQPLAPQRPCIFCATEHAIGKCFRTLEQRLAQVRSERRCLNCLSIRNSVSECPSPRRCRHCSQRHHTTICDRQIIPQAQTSLFLNDSLRLARRRLNCKKNLVSRRQRQRPHIHPQRSRLI